MKRHAFKMKLKPGMVAEYKMRHDEIWPELSQAIRDAGISDYSIFLDEETLMLFAVQKQTAINAAAQLPQLPIVKKW
jgi:L-rhamnose mutarotase